MSTAIAWYDQHATDVAGLYEAVDPDRLHAWLLDLIPVQGSALDVGAGTGRDAAWLAGRGLEVVAVEPSQSMREQASRLHPANGVQWLGDCLPDFKTLSRLGLTFDFILLSAVWMHVAPAERARAFRKLTSLLKPGGLLAMSLRIGPAGADRGMHVVTPQEVEQLAKDHGAFVERIVSAPDQQGRADVSWIQMAIRLPDDGTGALPLLRHITLNDDKSSTYKLGLLRALCRAADGTAGYAKPQGDVIAVPMGLIALNWLRLYQPLLKAGLPQAPRNVGLDGLGFVRSGFRQLLEPACRILPMELRVGQQFKGERAAALHAALRDACKTIEQMPMQHLTYPQGGGFFLFDEPGGTWRHLN